MSKSTVQVVSTIVRSLLERQGDEDIDPDSDLASLGVDSMRSIDLLLRVEQEFHLVLPDDYLNDGVFSTISSLAHAIDEFRAKGQTGD